MSTIFISYRRADSETITGRIYDRLADKFSHNDVFKDVNDIPPGADFVTVLENALSECAIQLVIIGPGWIDARNASGDLRLVDPDDFVRVEVETALQRPDTTVIPVLVKGARMPSEQQLPSEILKQLSRRHAVPVREDPDFHTDMDRLISYLSSALQDIDESFDSELEASGFFRRTRGAYAIGPSVTAEGQLSRARAIAVSYETVTAAFKSASNRLTNVRRTIADTGLFLQRPELAEVMKWIKETPSTRKLALLAGYPGDGKTVAMQDLLVRLQSDYVVLGIKADELAEQQSLTSFQDLQNGLRLPASVEDCVSIAASESQCVVLIDQVDALALTLNPDRQALRLIVSLIDRLRAIDKVKVIVSCRNFEQASDPVLAALTIDKRFQMGELSEDQINHVLETIDQPNFKSLSLALQSLLKRPLYLDLYVRIVLDTPPSARTEFNSIQDLYEKLWEGCVIRQLSTQTPAVRDRRDAVYALVSYMEENAQLTAPISILDDFADAAEHLKRTGFIQQHGRNVAFLHQTLFSYCYARRFAESGQSLAQTVMDSPQGFFQRPQIVQVLNYLAGANQRQYQTELQDMLFPPSGETLRYHLQLLLIQWLAWRIEPTDYEYMLIRRLERERETDVSRFLQAAAANSGWFALLSQDVRRWLANNNHSLFDDALRYLRVNVGSQTTEVFSIVLPYLGTAEEWNRRIAWLLFYIRDWQVSDETLDALMQLVREGYLSFHDSSMMLSSMVASNPTAGCRLLEQILSMALETHKKQDQTESHYWYLESELQKLLDDWYVQEFVDIVSASHPIEFVTHLLVIFLEIAIVVTNNRMGSVGNFPSNPYFDLVEGRHREDSRKGVTLGEGMIRGLQYVAKAHTPTFRQFLKAAESIEVYEVQQVIIRALLAEPEIYSDDIYQFLTTDKRRLMIMPDARKLFVMAHETSNDTRRQQWEHFALHDLPRDIGVVRDNSLETFRVQHSYWQRRQLDFLYLIDDSLLSQSAMRRKQELKRRYPEYALYSSPRVSVFPEVAAPVPLARLIHLSDDDLLRVALRYDDDTMRGGPRGHGLEGGVEQQSREFIELAKAQPERMYSWLRRFGESLSIEYIVAIFQGVANAEKSVSTEWLFEIFRSFYDEVSGYSRMGVASAIAQNGLHGVPDDVLEVLIDWALNDPNPSIGDERARQEEILRNTTDHMDGLINRAINSVRGSVLRSVVDILLEAQPQRTNQVIQLIELCSLDECDSVRTMAVECLARWLHVTQEDARAMDVLERCIEGRPLLLSAHIVQRFLSWLSYHAPNRAFPFLEAMQQINHEHTQYVAGQLICVAGLHREEFTELANSLHISSNPAIRRGATTIYAHRLSKPKTAEISRERLISLMHDEDERVREDVASCFNKLNIEYLMLYQDFILEWFFRNWRGQPCIWELAKRL